VSDFAIDVAGLSKTFGDKVAVDAVDIRMPRGQVWGFLGPNGSGKTTTIRMICGLLKPTAGSGTCLGFDILAEAADIKARTGYMTQHFSFWTDLTIRENLEFVARLYLIDDVAGVVGSTVETLGLSDRQHQLAGTLSGGWKQRLALAAVTMHDPQMLLLDEPTAGVDPQARRDFWDEIHRITSEKGVTALVSTHYMDEAERCDRIVYLANGHLLAQGTVAEIVDGSQLTTFVAEGDGVRTLMGQLKREQGIEHAAYFGAALHVSGTDRSLMEKALKRTSPPDVEWREERPTLEDAFIALTQRAGVDARQQG